MSGAEIIRKGVNTRIEEALDQLQHAHAITKWRFGEFQDGRVGYVVDDGPMLTPGEAFDRYAVYECMNCGERRTYGPLEWISCEDELGRSCIKR